ncbi:MAG: DUF1684 domain-containing protein [Phycisphaerales bacterium JB041]
MKNLAVVLLAPLAVSGCGPGDDPASPASTSLSAYTASVDDWHAERIAKLRSETGWLSLAALAPLGPGAHTSGADSECDIVLSQAPAPLLGTLTVTGDGVEFVAGGEATVTVFGDEAAAAVTAVPMVSDGEGNPTVLTSGSLLFHVIERGGELFLRVRDRNSPTLREFDGIERFPVDPRWRVTARLVPEPGATLSITNVLGQVETSPCPGALEFELEGQTHRLRPTVSADGSLFFVFADETNGKETYGAGRFLDAGPIGDDGLVELDFNKAHNPICAMSAFATCPLPPAGNRLPLEVQAGERYGH